MKLHTTFATMDFKNATLKIIDGTSPTPNEIEVKLGEGNLTWSEKKPRVYDKDRGKLGGVRDGDEMPLEVSFSARWEFLKGESGDPVTVYEALKKINNASGWSSVDSDPCAPYAVNLEFEFTPTCTDSGIETVVFPDFRYEDLGPDARGGIIAITGMCNVTEPTITRTPQP